MFIDVSVDLVGFVAIRERRSEVVMVAAVLVAVAVVAAVVVVVVAVVAVTVLVDDASLPRVDAIARAVLVEVVTREPNQFLQKGMSLPTSSRQILGIC